MKERRVLSFIGCVLCFCGLLFTACDDDSAYLNETDAWHARRVDALCKPRGWLSLAGLYEIHPGRRSIGSYPEADILFPASAPDTIGWVTLDSSGLFFQPSASCAVLDESESDFHGGNINIDEPPLLHFDALYWTFLERSGKYFVRLWDTLSPARQDEPQIERFTVDHRWRIEGAFNPADSGATIALDDVLGFRRPYGVAGHVHGTWHDTAFSILALDGGTEELFLIIEDGTTDLTTYAAGRYLYIDRPGPDGKVIIDFNKAYNPPCAFTEYATCLLAPPENRLSFAVTAGEKKYGH